MSIALKHPQLTRPHAEPRRARDDVSIEKGAVRGVTVEAMGGIYRKADLTPGSFNSDTWTVDAIFSTFADVRRRDHLERLDPSGLDLRGLIGAPVLDGHRNVSGVNVIGIVADAHLEGGKLVGTVRLVQSDDAKPIVERIKGGFLRDVSIGYRVQKWTESRDPETGGRVRTAVQWSVFEVSCVPIGADPGAKFRGYDMQDVIDDMIVAMPEEQQTAIRSLGELADLPPSWAVGQIEADASIEEARRAARAELTTRSQSTRIRVATPASEDPTVRLRTLEDALFARTTGVAPTDAARPFMGHSLRDLARETLQVRGVSTAGLDTDQLFRAAMHTTSDFPQLLQGVGSRTLMPAYQAAQSPLKSVLARQALRTDFRMGSKLRLGEIGVLQPVNEAGEIKSTTRAEAATSYALNTYGSIFTISRKALINDDLGAFRDWATAAGQAAAQTEAALLWTLLTQSGGAGPVMDDNKRLFHVDHGNLSPTGTSLTRITSLTTARKALRTMKGLDGKTPIAVTPKYLLVGPSRETEAEKLLTVINAAQTGDANPFAGKLTLLVEPRITDDSWYVFADPAQLPVLEYAYLSDAQGPQFASREGFEVLATEFRVTLDFGAGAVDWRGAYRDIGNADPDA